MEVTVFGLGYVGCVTAACLAEFGHNVTGIDLDETKVAMVNSGRSPIIEPQLDDLIKAGIQTGSLRSLTQADKLGDVAIICVGTPSNDNGSLSLTQVERVISDIAQLLQRSPNKPVINVRSTVLPGTVESTVVPKLEDQSGKKCGDDFSVCMNPEFIRETTAVDDFRHPPFTVIGATDDYGFDQVAQLYAKISAPTERTSVPEAEMIKYSCNVFHALKVCFANEMGNLSKTLGIDSHRVLDILCKDKKLNLSSYYMKPGFAFGGSCLPKDLRAILYKAKQQDVDMPLIASALESNRRQIDLALDMIRRTKRMHVGVLGLSFKSGTDDLRESPVVSLIESLIGKGYKIKIYDEEVSLAKLFGANRRFIEQTIPHISSLMTPALEEVFDGSEVIVVSKKEPRFAEAVRQHADGRAVIDLVRLWPSLNSKPANYEGICW